MPNYRNPETKFFTGLSRCYIASKAGGIVMPHAIDIHPVFRALQPRLPLVHWQVLSRDD